MSSRYATEVTAKKSPKSKTPSGLRDEAEAHLKANRHEDAAVAYLAAAELYKKDGSGAAAKSMEDAAKKALQAGKKKKKSASESPVALQESTMSVRVAFRHLVAKAKYLKALDFTIGLIKRLTDQGLQLPGGNNANVLKRLMEMRKMSQKGFSLETLLENKEMISGKGMAILKKLEKGEEQALPSERDLAAFVQPFSARTEGALKAQAEMLKKVIAQATGEDPDLIHEKMIKDAVFFDRAYEAVLPILQKAKAEVDGAIGGAAEGEYASRMKMGKSIFGKQGREKTSMLYFKDLVGCRVVTPSIQNMAHVAAVTQGKFDILDKKNYYLKNIGYNAINYNLEAAGIVVEFQLKTSVNEMEAALSHDLIYAPEKAIASLDATEKQLVAKVIDVSTQLSMKEWAEAYDIGMKAAAQY